MRNEVLRMERVTYKEDEVVKLKDFNLQIFQGEVMGFLPVNSHGKTALLKLLERNLPSMTVTFITVGKGKYLERTL